MSFSPMVTWIVLSIIWIILFLYVIDRMQKSKKNNEFEKEKRIQELEEKNKRLNNQKNEL